MPSALLTLRHLRKPAQRIDQPHPVDHAGARVQHPRDCYNPNAVAAMNAALNDIDSATDVVVPHKDT
jgi:hypothetical protein